MIDPVIASEMEAFIRQVFDQNYEELRLDSGHSITPNVKQIALNQVLLYWRILNEIAQKVTDTEVRLNLPGQVTPNGRDYSIEGVVDILCDNDRTVMYDIKTHNADYVRTNIEHYEQQLNVYAYIWQELRKRQLDEMAIIATDYPDTVRDALKNENKEELEYAISQWKPVVEIDFDPISVEKTIFEFGQVVDDIENGRFSPPSFDRLKEVMKGTHNIRFASQICSNCDARFSCTSYRQYAWLGNRATADRSMNQYMNEVIGDPEQEAWRAANIEAAQNADILRRDFTTR